MLSKNDHAHNFINIKFLIINNLLVHNNTFRIIRSKLVQKVLDKSTFFTGKLGLQLRWKNSVSHLLLLGGAYTVCNIKMSYKKVGKTYYTDIQAKIQGIVFKVFFLFFLFFCFFCFFFILSFEGRLSHSSVTYNLLPCFCLPTEESHIY